MSSKSHFIFENGIEGYEETNSPRDIFGTFIGFDAHLIIENTILKSILVRGQYLYIETKNTDVLPKKFKIWGDAVIEFMWEEDGLEIVLKGGHIITKMIIAEDWKDLLVDPKIILQIE